MDLRYKQPFEPGQTIIFIGDHTSPDDPGYTDTISGVVSRFHPSLNLKFISAGSRGQNAAALNSRALLDLITSSRPDWLVIGIGMADALREPAAARMLGDLQNRTTTRDDAIDVTFGPEYSARFLDKEPESDIGRAMQPRVELVKDFEQNLIAAVAELQNAGVRTILLTIAPLGDDPDHAVNGIMRVYSKVIRDVAQGQGAPLVDVERAFRDMLDRAANYKQRVRLTAPDGKLNVQGQTLIARTFLAAFDLLPPSGGFRPAR